MEWNGMEWNGARTRSARRRRLSRVAACRIRKATYLVRHRRRVRGGFRDAQRASVVVAATEVGEAFRFRVPRGVAPSYAVAFACVSCNAVASCDV